MAEVDKRLYKEVGTRVFNLRTKKGFSRQYLADQLKISAKFLYEIENGRKGFTVQVLNNLATIFGTTCDYLVRGEEPSTVGEVKKPEPEKRIDKVLKLFDGEEQDMIAIVLRTVYAVREKGEKKDPSSEE